MASAPVVELRVKKPNIFQKIKRWWKEDLTEDDRDIFKIAGIWFVDGAMIGAAVGTCACAKKAKKATDVAATAGYISGKMDAYKEMAMNPYQMPKTEQQNKRF